MMLMLTIHQKSEQVKDKKVVELMVMHHKVSQLMLTLN